MMQTFPLLLCALLSPAFGALLILLTPQNRADLVRRIAVAASGLSLACALYAITHYDLGAGGYQFQVQRAWMPSLGIGFHLGVDGIGVVLMLLHALCGFTGVLVSYAIKERVKEYYLFYLILITGVFGVFLSLDLFFFYFFYEMAVIPMYPLIGIWGSDVKEHGKVRFSKEYATMKLTIYLTLGAVVALVGLLWMYHAAGATTFDIPALEAQFAEHPLPVSLQRWIFPLLFVGFGVIAPMWPLHSWSPIGHAAAPSAVSMLHAGVLMKLGSYAIIRVALPLLPAGAHTWLPWVASIVVMNILYGGFVALWQKDLKLIVGYSSSSHMGYVLLGIACLTPLALTGAVMLMFAHGLMTALAFAIIGQLYDQTHTRWLPDLGGLAHQAPFIAGCGVMAAMASAGLPGFANFVSELLVFLGGWDKYPLQIVAGVFGVVITSVYMLRLVRGTFFGPSKPAFEGHVRDATTPFEKTPFVLLLLALLITGCWPGPMLRILESATRPLMERIAPGEPDHILPDSMRVGLPEAPAGHATISTDAGAEIN